MSSDPAVGRLLHIRSLNYLRRNHSLTYVASRILAESIQRDIIDDWTVSYLLRRSKTGREPVYWQHSLFKGLKPNGDPDFRKCLIGSPTTQLLEVWVLWKLSQEAAFAASGPVYSYLWPHQESHSVFRHFMDGYVARDRAIAGAAEGLKNPYVVVLDLKQFYPSIDRELAFTRFQNRVELSTLLGDEREAVLQCARGVCRPKKTKGLPIGPPLSHVLANIYLEDVDQRMEHRFPGRYFRYVDDVALVVERDEIEAAKELFSQIVQDEGLLVNEEKTDVNAATIWKARVEHKFDPGSRVTFSGLIGNLCQYLAHNPDDFDVLKARFHDEGFSLPFTNVKSVAEYKPFRRLAKRFLEFMGLAAVSRSVSPESLLQEARELRRHFVGQAGILGNSKLPVDGIQRKWAIQSFRYTFNRILYLVPREDLAKYFQLLPSIDELAEVRQVYKALVEGDISELVHYSGPAVSAFSQLWSESQHGKPHIEWSLPPKAHERDAVITLALYGLCEPPPDWINEFKSRTGYNRTVLRLVADLTPKRRTHNDFSYIDEVESLFLGSTFNVVELLKTRFDKDEDVVLPALNLGADYTQEAETEY